ncbi:MAG: hypothetical protein WC469_00370 [Candidatus Omnitrophota bacterium]|jgi:hypothetical protein
MATFLCVIYVYQQTEIFRFGYLGQKRLNEFRELQDRNATLRYSIEKGASLIRVGDKISSNMDFQMPDSYRLVKLDSNQPTVRGGIFYRTDALFSRIFGVRREAQAKTVNP